MYNPPTRPYRADELSRIINWRSQPTKLSENKPIQKAKKVLTLTPFVLPDNSSYQTSYFTGKRLVVLIIAISVSVGAGILIGIVIQKRKKPAIQSPESPAEKLETTTTGNATEISGIIRQHTIEKPDQKINAENLSIAKIPNPEAKSSKTLSSNELDENNSILISQQ